VWCGTEIYVPVAYFRLLWLAVFVTMVALGAATFNSAHAGTWLLVLILLAVPVRMIWGILVPPWIERGVFKPRLPFIAWYVAVSLTQFVYWSLWGWLHILLGASKAELSENWDTFSLPLYWINSAFLIRPDKRFADVCGIILGNSFFYTLMLFALYSWVHAKLNRSRAITLSIMDPESEDE
jgi:hypothetical protein